VRPVATRQHERHPQPAAAPGAGAGDSAAAGPLRTGTAGQPRAVPDGPRYPAKRAAIARAALALFVRDGYERTSVDAIAAEAGVSKRTVYSHYADKERLFLAVIEDTYSGLMDQVRDIADRELDRPGDARQKLTGFITSVARVISGSDERAALIRLIISEGPRFPALVSQWRGQRSVSSLLARTLASLPPGSGLAIDDPAQAADHLTALTLGQINNRSLFGLARLDDKDLDALIQSGIALFLRAYAA
jgi:TetR/AcrR family transcriptional regulator, mexJK operon transcriptional repressor